MMHRECTIRKNDFCSTSTKSLGKCSEAGEWCLTLSENIGLRNKNAVTSLFLVRYGMYVYVSVSSQRDPDSENTIRNRLVSTQFHRTVHGG